MTEPISIRITNQDLLQKITEEALKQDTTPQAFVESHIKALSGKLEQEPEQEPDQDPSIKDVRKHASRLGQGITDMVASFKSRYKIDARVVEQELYQNISDENPVR